MNHERLSNNHDGQPSPVRRWRRRALVLGLILLTVMVVQQLAWPPQRVDADLATLELTFTEHQGAVQIVDFSPDARKIASASYDGSAKIWLTESGRLVQDLPHPTLVTALAFSPDGHSLATGALDGAVRLWSVSTGDLLETRPGHEGAIRVVSFSPDGQTVASAGFDRVVRLRGLDGSSVRTLEGHEGEIWALAFSPDGLTLATSGEDAVIKIWDLASGDLHEDLTEHSWAVLSMTFSPDGRTLASGGDDERVRLWDTSEWEVLRVLAGGSECVYGVAFSPDGRRLVSGSRDKKALGEALQYRWDYAGPFLGVTGRLWDTETGDLLQTFSTHRNDVNDVAYSFDGQWIALAGADSDVSVWRVTG